MNNTQKTDVKLFSAKRFRCEEAESLIHIIYLLSLLLLSLYLQLTEKKCYSRTLHKIRQYSHTSVFSKLAGSKQNEEYVKHETDRISKIDLKNIQKKMNLILENITNTYYIQINQKG